MTDVQPTGTTSPEDVPHQARLTLLREILVTRFSVEELRTLCFDLGWEYDGLPGEGKEGRARELVAFLERRNRIPELEEKSKRLRPDITWEPTPETTKEKPIAVQPPPPTRLPPTPQETINREDVVSLFHRLMQPNSQFRVLRLLGQPKLGKSHLVAKVFPAIARRDYRAHYAVLTMRNQAQDTTDILDAACDQLGGPAVFKTYHAAYQDWLNRSKTQVTGIQALFSSITIKSEAKADEGPKMGRHLVPPFVTDIRMLNDAHVLLLFDAVENATESMQIWLMDVLLERLSRLPHARIVVAGRSVPAACGSYDAICESRELQPVEEEEAYITYCRQTGISLDDQSIRSIARFVDYKPGMFVEGVLPRFPHQGAVHA